MQDKSEFRKLARARLQTFSPEELALKSARICEELLRLPQWRAARAVCLFAALATEPDLAPLWKEAAGKTLVYPRVNGVELDLLAVDDPGALQTSRWQLREPIHDEAKMVASGRLDLILIPGLAFSREGARLGRGGGFYDRFLGSSEVRGDKIGVCFDAQIFPELPREPHDCAVDAVITESGFFRNTQSADGA
ncbi:MAG: 5-formyltetrahydrofolate cyclo-ligase [Chthoniobacter sp.]|jgi:5-formyltetrahydrofolate cyclo-ligase|nr:5-formyltetrahydrofolate cyclo-ligase [Chthoniobacter sp.]